MSARHIGQLSVCDSQSKMHTLQKMWLQGVLEASSNVSKQIGHSSSSELSCRLGFVAAAAAAAAPPLPPPRLVPAFSFASEAACSCCSCHRSHVDCCCLWNSTSRSIEDRNAFAQRDVVCDNRIKKGRRKKGNNVRY